MRALLSTLLMLILCGLAVAQKKPAKKNLTDYLNSIPTAENSSFYELFRDKRTKFEIRDNKNGYVRIVGDFDGYFEVALFRKKDLSPVLVLGETFCGPACGTDLLVFKPVDGKLVDITSNIFPKITEEKAQAELRRMLKDEKAEMVGTTFKLPRYGTTIKFFDDETETLLFEIVWKKNKFRIKESGLRR